MIFTCKICGATDHDKDQFFFFWDTDVWCYKHVPKEIKRRLGYK